MPEYRVDLISPRKTYNPQKLLKEIGSLDQKSYPHICTHCQALGPLFLHQDVNYERPQSTDDLEDVRVIRVFWPDSYVKLSKRAQSCRLCTWIKEDIQLKIMKPSQGRGTIHARTMYPSSEVFKGHSNSTYYSYFPSMETAEPRSRASESQLAFYLFYMESKLRAFFVDSFKTLHPQNSYIGDPNLSRLGFHVYMDEGSKNPKLPESRVVDSASSLDQAHAWIKECTEEHSGACGQSSNSSHFLPTRVIDVGLRSGPKILKLVNGSEHNGPYITLSHCWGKKPYLITTRATLDQYQIEIPECNLAKTSRDAIFITRNLGIRYLWIDYLCIIQDDMQDWERESAAMSDIYQKSFLTIAATSGVDGDAGCIYTDRPRTDSISLRCGVNVCRRIHDFNNAVENSVLGSRAWCFQERYLSPRILHCASEQMFWECRSACFAEDGIPTAAQEPWAQRISDNPQNPNTDFKMISPELRDSRCVPQLSDLDVVDIGDVSSREAHNEFWTALTSITAENFDHRMISRYSKDSDLLDKYYVTKKKLIRKWYTLVEAYSQCQLTYDSDKLPALGGLSRIFKNKLGDQYIFGLWESDFCTGLCWYSNEANPIRPTVSRAPSWSWAALNGPVSFTVCEGHESQFRHLCPKVIISGFEYVSADERRQLLGTAFLDRPLIFHGRGKRLDIKVAKENRKLDPSSTMPGQHIWLDENIPAEDGIIALELFNGVAFEFTGNKNTDVCFVVITSHSLLIAPTGRQPGQYRRVGYRRNIWNCSPEFHSQDEHADQCSWTPGAISELCISKKCCSEFTECSLAYFEIV